MTADSGIEPAWERRREIGFFKSIFLTIRGVMFCPSATFSRFKWEGGYWNPILLCLLVGGPSGLAVLFFTGFPLIGGVTVNFVTLAGLFLGLLLGLGADTWGNYDR